MHFMDFFKNHYSAKISTSFVCLPKRSEPPPLPKKKRAQSSGLMAEESTKKIEEEPGPDWFCKPGPSPRLRPHSLMTTSSLSGPCVQYNLDSKMSKPEPLLPMTLFSRKGTSAQTDIILIRHSCNLQMILRCSVQAPKTILYSFQMQLFTAGEQKNWHCHCILLWLAFF